jgi:FlaA1/EpsC-like NDP-sugar epimerase
LDYLSKKRILITGVCGTVGSELLKLLLSPRYEPLEVIGLDNNESELFFIDQRYLDDARAKFFVADIRDDQGLRRVMKNIDVVFHAAALKHVVLCERSPFEAVQSNIIGVDNVINAADENGVEKVIFTSSDKAVNPTNVMGTSKLMGERLITAANASCQDGGAIFASTRFGNVLGSNGSVIPIFHRQIAKGGPVSLTDDRMTRFIMSIEEAARLVIDSASIARGGEVFITKMPVIRIRDLAEVMVEELAGNYGYDPEEVSIEIIGAKPGEKLYEELMSEEETRRAVELEDYFSVLPAFRGFYKDISYEYPGMVTDCVGNPYVSENEPLLSRDELRAFLYRHDLLTLGGEVATHPDKRYWPGDKEEVSS